jgi:TolB protein
VAITSLRDMRAKIERTGMSVMNVPQLRPIVIHDEKRLEARSYSSRWLAGGLRSPRKRKALFGTFAALLILALVAVFGVMRHGQAATHESSRRIAFYRLQEGRFQIFTMNADGTDQQQITADVANHTQFSWSPDGQEIVFVSDIDGHDQIYLIDANGTNLHRLTNDDTQDHVPSWSPDGKEIAFLSLRGTSDSSIVVVNPDGSNLRRITDSSKTGAAFLPIVWSPDGRSIAFANGPPEPSNINLVTLSDATTRQLTHLSGFNTQPVWSPTSDEIVFIRYAVIDGTNESQLYLMHADGSRLQPITSGEFQDGSPAWSPDGSQIAFVRESNQNFSLVLMNADGSHLQTLTSAPAGRLIEYPSWSSDGKSLQFATIETAASGTTTLRTIGADGKNLRTLATDAAPGSWPELVPAD